MCQGMGKGTCVSAHQEARGGGDLPSLPTVRSVWPSHRDPINPGPQVGFRPQSPILASALATVASAR